MDPVETLRQTILSRHSVSPKRLVEPGPDGMQIKQMIEAASCAPDHGQLRPWRFVQFPQATRDHLADVFEQALVERLPDADGESRQRARDKAGRGPVLLGIIVRLDGDELKGRDPKTERVLAEEQYTSAGAALQNILLMTHAMGFAARTTSGHAVRTATFRTALKLATNEQFLCFVSIGTADSNKPAKPRPDPADLFSVWDGVEIHK